MNNLNFPEKILCSLVMVWFCLYSPLTATLGVHSHTLDAASILLGIAAMYLGARILRNMSKTDPRAAEYFNDPLITRMRSMPLIKYGLRILAVAVVWALLGVFAAEWNPLPVGIMVVVFVLLVLAAFLAWSARLYIWIIDKSND